MKKQKLIIASIDDPIPTPTDDELAAAADRWKSFRPWEWKFYQGLFSNLNRLELWEDHTEALDTALSELLIAQTGEISVTGNTDFGVTGLGGVDDETFTISNTGYAPLTGVNISVPAGFSLLSAPPAIIGAGVSATFTIRSTAAAAGTFSGDVIIETNELDDYNFGITSTVFVFVPSSLPSPIAAIDFHEGGSTLNQASNGAGSAAVANNDPIGYAAQISGFSATPAIQATSAAKPTLKVGANGINDHNAASFDGGDNLVWTGITASSGAKTIYLVVDPTSAAGSVSYFLDSLVGRLLVAHFGSVANQVAYYDGMWRDIANATANAQILTFALGSGTGTIYRNDVSIGSADYVNKAIGDETAIGSSYNGSGAYYNGLYGAIYLYNALHTADERTAMYAYLSSRWGIS